MASIIDVATYIVAKTGPVSAMKLQKLCYYAQAWSLVWEDRPIFDDRLEAWANGPVAPTLYAKHAGQFTVSAESLDGNAEQLDDADRDTIDRVLAHYGDKAPQWLSDLTHNEAPWKDARGGLSPGTRSNALVSQAAMAEYYGSL